MKHLNLPAFDYKIRPYGAGAQIFDVVRRKYVWLTDEEWVRQHLLHYMLHDLGYPRALIRLEPRVCYNNRHHRPDIVVYNRAATLLMLLECKAPHVAIRHDAWEQSARYNAYFRALFVAITNGRQHFCWRLDDKQGLHQLLPAFPRFDFLLTHGIATLNDDPTTIHRSS